MPPRSEDDELPAPRPHRRVFSADERQDIQRIARTEVVEGWENVGVDFGDVEKRREFARLVDWIRERKKIREAGVSKIVTAGIGSLVTALVGAAAAAAMSMLTGRHL